jgi:hypothetical protein
MVVVFVVGRDHRSGAGAKIASFVARLVVKAVVGKTRGSSLAYLPTGSVRTATTAKTVRSRQTAASMPRTVRSPGPHEP